MAGRAMAILPTNPSAPKERQAFKRGMGVRGWFLAGIGGFSLFFTPLLRQTPDMLKTLAPKPLNYTKYLILLKKKRGQVRGQVGGCGGK